jgi:alpha-glucosidase
MAPTRALDRVHQIDQPEVQDVLRAFRRLTDGTGERVLIGEAYLPLDKLMAYYGKGDGVHLPFNFQLIGADWNAGVLAALIARYEALLPPGGWPNWVLGNHDRSRVASRFGRAAAPAAAMLLLTLRGTPTLYYGDELGLTDVPIPPALVQDPWEKRVPGHGLGRDPVRTPMPWDATANAGFTTGTPWLPLNADHETVNVAAARADPNSLLTLTRALIMLRRAEPALTLGAYGMIQAHENVLFYERVFEKRRLQIALNLGAAPATVPVASGTVLLSTHPGRQGEPVPSRLMLAPDEGAIVRAA